MADRVGREIDPYSIEAGGDQQVIIQDGIGRTGGIVIGIVAGLALGMAVISLVIFSIFYRELERESRLQQLKMDEYRVALMKAGIEPNPHVDGESK